MFTILSNKSLTRSIQAALVAGVGVTALQLPGLEDTSYLSRACFCITLVIALLATFFTCLQQRTYGFIEDPGAIRAWLANGVRYLNVEGEEAMQSSTVSHQLLQTPFELLCISITTFLFGFAVYLGSAFTQNIKLGLEQSIGNRGVLIAFCVATAFVLGLLGQVLGGKDVERNRLMRQMVKAEGVRTRMLLDTPTFTPSWLKKTTEDGALSPAQAEAALAPRISVSEVHAATSLTKALQQAAIAHQACAAADAEVARWYEIMASGNNLTSRA